MNIESALLQNAELSLADGHLQALEQSAFTLKTCQRQLYLGFKAQPFHTSWSLLKNYPQHVTLLEGQQAYQYLLEVICGLQSQLLGESEIVGQFKSAYQEYIASDVRSTYIMEVLEKLFKDAKEIRTQYLMQIGQYSYSGLAKKILAQRQVPQQAPILITGAGKLAHDLIKVLRKKYHLTLCARNRQKVEHLATNYQLETLEWDYLGHTHQYPLIINTIGAEQTVLFNQNFFAKWQQQRADYRSFIDLGSPSVLELGQLNPSGLYLLEDIFSAGGKLKNEKKQKVFAARQAIEQLSVKRINANVVAFPFGWEDVHFV